MPVVLSVVVGIVTAAGLIASVRWARRQYRDFCELRRWAIAVQQEVIAVKTATAPKKPKA